jgi:hypothetical protein
MIINFAAIALDEPRTPKLRLVVDNTHAPPFDPACPKYRAFCGMRDAVFQEQVLLDIERLERSAAKLPTMKEYQLHLERLREKTESRFARRRDWLELLANGETEKEFSRLRKSLGRE